jgi:hypothetical protein
MSARFLFPVLALAALVLAACDLGGDSSTSTPTSTSTPLPTTSVITPAPTGSPGETGTPVATVTPTTTPTETATGTATPEPTPTTTVLHLFGTITVNGEAVPAGTPFEIRAGDIVCADGEITELGGQSTYAADIDEACGGDEDWAFYIQGFPVADVARQEGQQDVAGVLGSTQTPTPTTTVEPTSTEEPLTPTSTTEPTGTVGPSPEVTPIGFALGADENDDPVDLVEGDIAFGATELFYFLEYSGLTTGSGVRTIWRHDDDVFYDSNEAPWDGDESGSTWYSTFYTERDPLPIGRWSFEFIIDGVTALTDEVEVVEVAPGVEATSGGFSSDIDDEGNPVGLPEGGVLPAGITKLYFFFDYSGFTEGTGVRNIWRHDDEVFYDSGDAPWEAPEEGNYWYNTFYEDDTPLPAGTWTFELIVDGVTVLADSVDIGGGEATPTTEDLPGFFELLAAEIVELGYDPTGEPVFSEQSPGRFLIAQHGICTGSADGKCQAVFFYLNDEYLGRDAPDPYWGISLPVATDHATIALEYANYLPDDPLCCPTGEPIVVEFWWDGTTLASDAEPPTAE